MRGRAAMTRSADAVYDDDPLRPVARITDVQAIVPFPRMAFDRLRVVALDRQ
jgi:hypothetical protein